MIAPAHLYDWDSMLCSKAAHFCSSRRAQYPTHLKTNSQHPRMKLLWCQVTRWTLNKKGAWPQQPDTTWCSGCTIGTKKSQICEKHILSWGGRSSAVYQTSYLQSRHFLLSTQKLWHLDNINITEQQTVPSNGISVSRTENTKQKQQCSTTDGSNW